jgi:DNA polymerase-3 subunit gamma/tau
MFENIVGHTSTIQSLKNDLSEGKLPGALLFFGPRYAGKLTAALELARALTCEEGLADWNCGCNSCKKQRALIHPDILLLGSRYFLEEIKACARVLEKHQAVFSQYLFTRAVHKLTSRFDTRLWEPSDPKLKKVQGFLEAIEENLEPIQPGQELPSAKLFSRGVEKIVNNCEKIVSFMASDNIPITQIRKATWWAHTTSPGKNKVIIIESADRMHEGSRNALLKILEEPPRGVYFILLSTRRGGIIPTILSRVRPYHFPERNLEESAQVLSRIFREEGDGYRRLRDFFHHGNIPIKEIRAMAVTFLEEVQKGNTCSGLETLGGKELFTPFLEELTGVIKEKLREPLSLPMIDRLDRWNRLIRHAAGQHEEVNQHPKLLLEDLFYRMKEGM